ncbi:hypothetical protein BU16DRAFT_521754 [Lophium mytilinum]|uniref:F-box domain-containing protein n=1 Tax=Lophium mytilinum TaxID=390894 RepID=A0A6A6RI52_9PEZI|nr:hypothetical protein BU16DRAFT_521754 [Lophium mytilinum]
MNFLDLPRELRDNIYAYVLTSSTSLRAEKPPTNSESGLSRTRLDTAILRTSRLIHDESSEVLYKTNRFRLGNIFYTTPLDNLLKYFLCTNTYGHHVRSIHVYYLYDCLVPSDKRSDTPSGVWERIRADAQVLVSLFPNLRTLQTTWGFGYQMQYFPSCPFPKKGTKGHEEIVEETLGWLRGCVAEDGVSSPECLKLEWRFWNRAQQVDQEAFDEALELLKKEDKL